MLELILLSYVNHVVRMLVFLKHNLHMKRKKVYIKTRLTSGLTFTQGEDTKPATVKWSIISTIEPSRTFVYDKDISAGGSSGSVTACVICE